MNHTVISGDIISSTSLRKEDKILLEDHLNNLIQELKSKFDIYARLIKGDYLECYVPVPGQSLQIALLIKSFVKSISIDLKDYKTDKKRAKLFKEHGIRIAIGYGGLNRLDLSNGIIDGEAIYMSGRLINSNATYNKDRIVIKNTLFFKSTDPQLNKNCEAILGLLDVLLSKATARQSEVLYLKLLGKDEKQISKELYIDQSVVNRHSTSVGWNAIETVLAYYNSLLHT